MFNGSKDTQQAATQKLLEAVVHLRRASDALLAVQPLLPVKATVAQDRKQINMTADRYDNLYIEAAREAFA